MFQQLKFCFHYNNSSKFYNFYRYLFGLSYENFQKIRHFLSPCWPFLPFAPFCRLASRSLVYLDWSLRMACTASSNTFLTPSPNKELVSTYFMNPSNSATFSPCSLVMVLLLGSLALDYDLPPSLLKAAMLESASKFASDCSWISPIGGSLSLLWLRVS